MSTTRQLLECLGRASLIRLMRERGLPPTRTNDEGRTSLTRSYRGDVEDFIRDGSQLFLSPGDFLPLVVSGELPLIGRVEMELKEVHLK